MNNSIKFGTDGIRGNAQAFPFISSALYTLGKAIYSWVCKDKKTATQVKVLLMHDTRESCSRIKKDLIKGLLTHHVQIIDGGVFSTPGACIIMQQDRSLDVAIIISASHNPYYDNGIKIVSRGGKKLTAEDEQQIATYFSLLQTDKEQTEIIGSLEEKDFFPFYAQHITSHFTPQFLSGKKIVLDCAHGATSAIAPAIFSALDADVVITAATPNGTNINAACGALHPEELQKLVVAENAFAGFAFDGDGDRIVAVTASGEVRDGDDILWLLAQTERYAAQHTIVGTVMTNSGFETALTHDKKELARVDVGDKHIAKKLYEQKLLLGGEPSGHIILHDYLSICDGIFVALRMLESMIHSNNYQMKSFNRFPQAMRNVAIKEKKDLTTGVYANIIEKYRNKLSEGRILVRYSGTENILRVMAEAHSQDLALTIVEELSNDLKQALQ